MRHLFVLSLLWVVPAAADEDFFALTLDQLVAIEVTAQKRPELLQSVPLSIGLLPVDRIEAANLRRLEDIAQLDSSLSFDKRISFNKSSIKIRGIGTQVFGAGVEPSVATFVDGVVMSRGGAGFDDLHDIERIEVLRGPQSTLFGKNASAGVLHVVTPRPQQGESAHKLTALWTDDREYRLGVVTSGPVSKSMAYRFSAYGRDFDGNVDNVFNGHSLNDEQTWGLRAGVLWQLSDTLSMLLRSDYSRQDTSNGVRVLRSDSQSVYTDPAAIGEDGLAATAGQITGVSAAAGNDKVNLDRDPFVDSEAGGVSLEVDWQLGDYQLTSLSAWRHWQQDNDRDNDQTQLAFSLAQLENRDVDWYSQELRINSPLEGRYDYVAGLYLYYADNQDNSGDDRTFSNDPYLVEFNLADNRIENSNAALFGQLNYHASDALTVFVGLRGLYDQVDVELSRRATTHNNAYLADGSLIANRDVESIKNDSSDTALTGKAGLSYQWQENISSYVSYTHGYKGAAFGTSFKFNPELFLEHEPVDPEQSDSVEIGLRSLWRQWLQLNATVFYSRFDGLHLTVRDLANNRNVLGSVPEVVSQGVELDAVAQLQENFSLHAAVSYLDARYEDFDNANCYARQTEAQGCVSSAGGSVQDLSGHRLAQAPEWKLILGGRYEMQAEHINSYLQLNLRSQSQIFLDAAGSIDAIQPGYGVLDASAGVQTRSGRYAAKLFIKNLLDKQYVSGASINGNAGGDQIMQLIPRDYRRYLGVELSYNF